MPFRTPTLFVRKRPERPRVRARKVAEQWHGYCVRKAATLKSLLLLLANNKPYNDRRGVYGVDDLVFVLCPPSPVLAGFAGKDRPGVGSFARLTVPHFTIALTRSAGRTWLFCLLANTQ